MGIMKDLSKFVDVFKKDLRYNDHIFELKDCNTKAKLICMYEYDKHRTAFDMILNQNAIRAMIRYDLIKAIKVKYNEPNKGYLCTEMDVIKIKDMIHMEFTFVIIKGGEVVVEYLGIGLYGVTYSNMEEYFTNIDISDEADFYNSLDDMRAIYGDDVILIKMEA